MSRSSVRLLPGDLQDEAVDLTLRLISHELNREDIVGILDSAIDLI